MIKVCTCQHEGQDSIHGRNRRVYNISKKGTSSRCTVCGKESPLSKMEIEDGKKKNKNEKVK